jgi:hypothetical protein
MTEQRSMNPKAVDYTPRGAERLYYLSHGLHLSGRFRIAGLLKRANQFLFHVNIPPPLLLASGYNCRMEVLVW